MVEQVREISKKTTLSLALVISTMGIAYQAGQQKHRIDSLERDATRTTEVLAVLRTLTEKMDKRLSLLEDRNARDS